MPGANRLSPHFLSSSYIICPLSLPIYSSVTRDPTPPNPHNSFLPPSGMTVCEIPRVTLPKICRSVCNTLPLVLLPHGFLSYYQMNHHMDSPSFNLFFGMGE